MNYETLEKVLDKAIELLIRDDCDSCPYCNECYRQYRGKNMKCHDIVKEILTKEFVNVESK